MRLYTLNIYCVLQPWIAPTGSAVEGGTALKLVADASLYDEQGEL